MQEVAPAQSPPWYKSSRYFIAVMAFLGFLNVYALRVNLSVAAVKMADQYNWSQTEKALILSSFFYGYIATQIPGGWVATRLGGKWVFGLGVFVTAAMTLLTPVVAAHKGLLLAVRVLEGIGEGGTFPAMHAMLSRWAPPAERSRLATICYAGSYFGTVVSLPISGVLASGDFLGGWPSVFYVFGTLGVLWFIAWVMTTSNNPESHRWIKPEELRFIQESMANQSSPEKPPPTPWLPILSSSAVWAIIVAHTCQNWGFYTLLTCLPTYFNDVLRFNIESGGINAAYPYLALFLLTIGIGQVADHLRSRFSTVFVRKLLNTTGYVIGITFLVLAGFVKPGQNALAVTYLTLSVGSGGFVQSGFNINHLDISPRYAGVLMGLTNCAGTIPGFVGPTVAGILAPCALCDKTINVDGYCVADTYWEGPGQCPPNTTDVPCHTYLSALDDSLPADVQAFIDGIETAKTTTSPGTHNSSLPAKIGNYKRCSQHIAQVQWRNVFYLSASIFAFGALVFLVLAKGTVQPFNDIVSEETAALLGKSVNLQPDSYGLGEA